MTATAQHDRLKTGHAQNQWSESKAQQLAAQTGIHLSEAHWEVIRYVRDYYLERGFVRRSRELSSAMNTRFHEQGGQEVSLPTVPRRPRARNLPAGRCTAT